MSVCECVYGVTYIRSYIKTKVYESYKDCVN